MLKKQTLTLGLMLLLSSCATPTSQQPVEKYGDYSMFLPITPLTSNFYNDLNDLPMTKYLERQTGLLIDYDSPMPGQEDITFTFNMSTKEMADIFRYDLSQKYGGGVDMAVEDGMIHDYTALLEEYAPNFTDRIQQHENYRNLAYSDNGLQSCFGRTLVDEELRGLPFSGPMINKTLLDQAGLTIPETIADWEIVLNAFADLGVIPFSFGGDLGFEVLYDTFASAYGVTIGELFYQENGKIHCSPMEEGYYDFLVMLNKWYENGWIQRDFYNNSHNDIVKLQFEKGEIGASVFSTSTLITGPVTSQLATGNAMEFVPVPYPVLQKGDTIKTREYTPDFYGDPIFIHSNVENPEEIIQWIDFFYSEEGINLTNWGQEGETYTINSQGEKEFTDLVTQNPDHPSVTVLAQEAFQEMSLVKEWEKESSFYTDGIHDVAWEQWGLATYQHALPQTMTYSSEESHILTQVLYSIESYVYQSTVNFIMGLEPLSNYDTFTQTLTEMGIEEVIEINQNALDRYQARSN